MKQLQPESGNPRYANARASGVHASGRAMPATAGVRPSSSGRDACRR